MNKKISQWLFASLALSAFMLTACNNDDGDIQVEDENPETTTVDTLVTASGTQFVRTPEENFENLPDWPYAYQYVEIDGLRQAYAEAGPSDGEVVLLLHGQPSWSYLYRYMIPILSDAGYRVIAMDHLGMGRSDKPVNISDYSYLGHSDRLERFIQQMGLSEVNLFVQDWGSLIGLRVAGLNTDWFASIAVGNGALPVIPAGVQAMTPIENPDEVIEMESPFTIPEQQEPFYDGCDLLPNAEFDFDAWALYSMKGASYTASEVVEALTWYDLSEEVEAAYDAPFPSREYMAGTRTFPALVNEVAGQNDQAWMGLLTYEKPFLTIWGDNDHGSLGTCEAQQTFIDNVPGAEGKPHTRLSEAGHFLQSDQGEEIANQLVDFYATDWESETPDSCENFDSPIENEGRTQFLAPPSDLKNYRYAEILPVFECGEGFVTEVYISTTFSEAPQDEWDALDIQDLKSELGAFDVELNGPRYWLVNSSTSNEEGTGDFEKIATFGTLQMGLAAQISGRRPSDLYTEGKVQRSTTYVFEAGTEVYKLISPDGDVYVMQSYSNQINADLTMDDLASLGTTLDRPSGWVYVVEILSEDLVLVADGVAHVIKDELENSYQKMVD